MDADNNPVNPDHYKKRGGIETINYLEAVCADIPGDEAVSVANIIKYVSRYRQKNPDNPTRDLRKAAWYLSNLIQLVEDNEAARIYSNPPTPHDEWDYEPVPYDVVLERTKEALRNVHPALRDKPPFRGD